MTGFQRRGVFVLGIVLAILATWNWYVEAQAKRDPPASPFVVLGTQDTPPVTLFEHRPSGKCFLGWKTGGLIQVDTDVCKGRGGFLLPIILPIIPPDNTVSPER